MNTIEMWLRVIRSYQWWRKFSHCKSSITWSLP